MIRPLAIAVSLVATIMVGSGANAAPPTPSCSIAAWSIDTDRRGQAIRTTPSLSARVAGRLAPYRRPAHIDPGDDWGFGRKFEIVAARHGWFYVRGEQRLTVAFDPETSGSVWERIEGWMDGRDLRFAIAGRNGFQLPDHSSRLVAGNIPQSAFIRLLNCSGQHGRVEWSEKGRRRSAWFEGVPPTR